MARRKDFDPFEKGMICENILECEVFIERRVADLSRNIRMGEDCFNFGGKKKRRAIEVIVNRFHTKAVAGKKESAGTLVPKCKSEHAVKMVNAICSPFFIRVNDSLCVRP